MGSLAAVLLHLDAFHGAFQSVSYRTILRKNHLLQPDAVWTQAVQGDVGPVFESFARDSLGNISITFSNIRIGIGLICGLDLNVCTLLMALGSVMTLYGYV